MAPFETFTNSLKRSDLVSHLGASVIGSDARIDGPNGSVPLVYADYVASGRALRPVEEFVMQHVLPYYANSHTDASFCGSYSTRLREAARTEIARLTGAGPGCSVIFNGSGATAGINRIVGLLEIAQHLREGRRVRVLVGPYEHHSNLLPWRESGAEIIEIGEASDGGPDLVELERSLIDAADSDLLIGSFSAASNVTGILCPVDEITALLKRHGAVSVWDYAGGAPYLPMQMGEGDHAKDAIVYSSHKFPGGPGASGVLVLRDSIARRAKPTLPGGGTVSFVSPWKHAYSCNVVAREEAGTPNVVGDIRAALVLLVQEAVGLDFIRRRDRDVRAKALAVWDKNPRLELLGNHDAEALPIFAFRVRDAAGGLVHHQMFTRMLSDLYGIQARGGCACAGSYAHRLLGIDKTASDALMARLEQGAELEKPGWVRLNFSYLMDDDKVNYIIEAVDALAYSCYTHKENYAVDPATARFSSRSDVAPHAGSVGK